MLQKPLERNRKNTVCIRSSALFCGCFFKAKCWDVWRWREQGRTWKCCKMGRIRGKGEGTLSNFFKKRGPHMLYQLDCKNNLQTVIQGSKQSCSPRTACTKRGHSPWGKDQGRPLGSPARGSVWELPVVLQSWGIPAGSSLGHSSTDVYPSVDDLKHKYGMANWAGGAKEATLGLQSLSPSWVSSDALWVSPNPAVSQGVTLYLWSEGEILQLSTGGEDANGCHCHRLRYQQKRC